MLLKVDTCQKDSCFYEFLLAISRIKKLVVNLSTMKMKTPYILLIGLFVALNLTAQESYWQTAIYASDEWTYMEGSPNIPSNWNQLGFDDSAWEKGEGSIGYGDGDDATIIAPVVSLFMRKTFTVSDKNNIIIGLFSADYDDGYVAYLNGQEIARENLVGTNLEWNTNTPGEHEAQMYQGGDPTSYLLVNNLNDLLVEGENVLAVQTHNRNGLSSSDMTTQYWLSFSSLESNPDFGPTPEFLGLAIDGFNTRLPIVRINTTNGEEIPNEPKIEGSLEIVYDNLGGPNNSVAQADEFEGNIRIEKRGQTSLFLFPKNSFLFETIDEDGEDLDVSFLNFPSEEDFILHGPYSDKTLMRNVLIFDVANKMGQYASRTRYVELIVNGSYEGIYVMMERIKRDNNRVDIANLREEDISGDELTGGYIIKIDKDFPDWFSQYDVATANGKKLEYQLVYPRRDKIMPEQKDYIKSYVDSFEMVMVNPETELGGKSYLDFIDLESFVDHFLLVEFAMDIDAYRFSTYMHKDKDSNGGKLKCGPLWDFNLSFGNANFCDGANPNGYMYNRHCDLGNPFWWGRLMNQEVFRDHAKCRWQELRKGVLHQDSLFQYIEEQVSLLEPSLDRNYEKWPVLNEWVWPNPEVHGSYEGEIDFLKDFITDRLFWMDNNLFGFCDSTLVIEPEEGFDYILSPNPASDVMKIIFDGPIEANISFDIYDMVGREVSATNIELGEKFVSLDLRGLPAGAYNLFVRKNDFEYAVKRFILIK